MIEQLIELDTRCFRWVNGHHCTVADWALWAVSQHWCWAAVLAVFFVAVCLRYDRERWWLAVAAVALCFLVADQSSVHLFKETICRLRPCHALDDVRMFRTRCGGAYGFVSSHAANAFAIATWLICRYRHKSHWAAWLIALWAIATSYSRAYLGKHYPGDLVCGAMLGVAIGAAIWAISTWTEKKLKKSGTKS